MKYNKRNALNALMIGLCTTPASYAEPLAEQPGPLPFYHYDQPVQSTLVSSNTAVKEPTEAPVAQPSKEAEALQERLRSINTQQPRKVERPETTGAIPALPDNEPAPLYSTYTATSSDMRGMWQLQREAMHFFAGGIEFRNRSGEEGLDKLFESRLPLSFNFNIGQGRMDFTITSVFLSSGDLTSDPFTNRFFGTYALSPAEDRPLDESTDTAGQEISIGYEAGGLKVRIGTTPLGFEVTNGTGDISFNHSFNSGFNFGVGAFIEPIKDSVLSYSGIKDPISGLEWGGIMKKGGTFSLGYDAGNFGVYFDLTSAIYEGESVADNDFAQINTGLYFFPQRNEQFEMATGFNITAFGFENNMRFFTFGQGGYFSPESFLSASIPLRMTYTEGKVTVKLDLGLGVQFFEEEAASFYPSDPDLQQQLVGLEETQPTTFEDDSERQFGTRGSAALIYQINPQLSFNSQIGFSNAADYKESIFLLGMEHRFGKKR